MAKGAVRWIALLHASAVLMLGLALVQLACVAEPTRSTTRNHPINWWPGLLAYLLIDWRTNNHCACPFVNRYPVADLPPADVLPNRPLVAEKP